MNEAILCLGSTVGSEAKINIDKAFDLMSYDCRVLERTDVYPSASGYHNCVARIATDLPCDELVALTKDVERVLGREPWHKDLGIVVVDIDVVTYNGVVKRELDYRSQYFIDGMAMLGQ